MENSSKQVQLYSKVTLKHGQQKGKYTIVRSDEVDISEGKISSKSPLGRELLKRGERDIVEIEVPRGVIKCEILAVE